MTFVVTESCIKCKLTEQPDKSDLKGIRRLKKFYGEDMVANAFIAGIEQNAELTVGPAADPTIRLSEAGLEVRSATLTVERDDSVAMWGEVQRNLHFYEHAMAVHIQSSALSGFLSAIVENMVADLTPEQRDELIYYFTVGSTNMDYRSMVMDGEVMVVLGGWQALLGFMDFLLLPGLCEWVETTEQLDALLPPPGGFVRGLAGLMKLSL